jgi:hypothetical protein
MRDGAVDGGATREIDVHGQVVYSLLQWDRHVERRCDESLAMAPNPGDNPAIYSWFGVLLALIT